MGLFLFCRRLRVDGNHRGNAAEDDNEKNSSDHIGFVICVPFRGEFRTGRSRSGRNISSYSQEKANRGSSFLVTFCFAEALSSAARAKNAAAETLAATPELYGQAGYPPHHGFDCAGFSVVRTTMTRTMTLRTNPTTKLNPAAYLMDRSVRSKIPGGLSLCTIAIWMGDGRAQGEDAR